MSQDKTNIYVPAIHIVYVKEYIFLTFLVTHNYTYIEFNGANNNINNVWTNLTFSKKFEIMSVYIHTMLHQKYKVEKLFYFQKKTTIRIETYH